jgi:general secretion pathway protein E
MEVVSPELNVQTGSNIDSNLALSEQPLTVEESNQDSAPGLGLAEALLPYGFARRHSILLRREHDEYVLYFASLPAPSVIAEARRCCSSPLKLQSLEEGVFKERLAEAYSDSGASREVMEGLGDDMDLASLADSVPETEDLLEQEDDAPIIRLINGILSDAIKREASDIHIETFENRLLVRFRVDGVMQEVLQPKRALAPLLVSRIKVMSKMDIAEKRVPQDGRIALKVGGREVDVRVSTLPSNHGERVVMRLLDKQAGRLDLNQLGMDDFNNRMLKQLIFKPHGIILVTGPTGSGKTTTLYASLAELNDSSRNILTVEDPIEYSLPGVGQTQVNTKADMTFARGLRAILRQDPDVVMIGEIRDLETAGIAVEASLTGHLVLSTLHTNTAIGAVTRLQDMGIEPFLLASSLLGVVAQRLVRMLCPECRKPYQADNAEKELLGRPVDQPLTLYHPNGCSACTGSGYRGRRGIYEIVEVNDDMRCLIHDGAGEIELEKYARMRSPGIRQDGIKKILQGMTTVEEVLRVTKG